MLWISNNVQIPDREIILQAMRSQGAGGQNVNKVSSAIHLFFDIRASSLPESYKVRLLAMRSHGVPTSGVIVLKAQEHRSQADNREAALERLRQIIRTANTPRKSRKATRPSRASKERRLKEKTHRARIKSNRGGVDSD